MLETADAHSVVISFICLACHSKATLKSPAPFYGGKEVLPSFLHLNSKYEMTSSSIMAARPIAFIYFILSSEDPICMPVSIISPKENGSGLEYVVMTVSHVLSTVLSAYSTVLKNDHIVFLVCGSVFVHPKPYNQLMSAVLHFEFASAIVFTAKHFQPLVASSFFLVFVELVLVEQLCVHKTFPELLSLSGHLGLHTKVILVTLDPTSLHHQLECTIFACAHTQTQPWGIEVPMQCPQCGSIKSWSEKIALTSAVTSELSVTRFHGELSKDHQVWMVLGTIYILFTSFDNRKMQEPEILAEHKEDCLAAKDPKRHVVVKFFKIHYYHQFITDEDDRKAEVDILCAEQEGYQSAVSQEEREANAHPKDASFYKKQLTDWDVAQKLFK
ncbi:uncharacterized protein HD556DRAFT_1302831 [Suillus plorans]|uniref:Uncharacterized protein n=1 Tax=Suillus plorans TaxID=116603 RepID=A0A9P7DY71_9AGAM|nr:uncharacterized protein HD556DRAFT_1302831 [Suillus plorans]KAG1806326.1 hypothetical protein HD556DRAFT_1302831 [Suillus plorans]